ncbi:uncharacterized protein LOC135841536 isoform X2 [Planococcus citri]|uniref:uncharacterized protein LOC135841536 isoform X2 n=1 Tax=Planococcus citri TaxID=170843 RepID=UPI0031F7FFA7
MNDEVCIFSLNSQHPVFVNEEPVSAEGKALKDRDEIRINDDYKFGWKTATDRRIFSRSLPLGNEPSLEVNARYSDSALITWKNVDRVPEECTETDVTLQNPSIQRDDEPVSEEETLSETDGVEKSNVSIPGEINPSSVECGIKLKNSVNTPVKSQKSINPVTPFTVSNTSVSHSKNNTSKISCQNDETETELECSASPEDVFEDLIIPQAGSQKAYHSTPKATTEFKHRKIAHSSSFAFIDVDFENDDEMDTSELTLNCDVVKKTGTVSEKSICNETKKSNSASKKFAITPTKCASEEINGSRRNTRGRTSPLRKTFEENSCDNEVKSSTTPEKLTETSNITQTSLHIDSKMENGTDTNVEYKSLNESAKAGFVSVSDENDTCETSFIDKYKIFNVVKNISVVKPGLVAKCARNLSYISPPENNRSQEYMDSMVTTPQKNSLSIHESITENFNITTPSFLSNTKNSSFDESMNTSLSSARKRRSTGFIPFVGTPSNEYRVTRKMSTPFSRSVLSRTSIDSEGTLRDGKQSFERRLTPYKLPSSKSSMRDSISCQPTIQENVSFEELEAGNQECDSTNDPKFQFITKRCKQRYGENTFAEEDRILEESELNSDCTELDNDCSFEEENTVASITNASITSDDCEELSNDDGTATETEENALEFKSILTPLPKCSALKERSAKRVTFVLPASPGGAVNEENSTLSFEESFAMINSSKPAAIEEHNLNYDSIISDEESHAFDKQETNLLYNAASEPKTSVVRNLIAEKCDECSLNISGSQSQTKIKSNLNDLSSVEKIQSPKPSPTKCNMSATNNDISAYNGKIDTLNETPTNDERSLISLEPSNRSNLIEDEHSRTFIEVESVEEMPETTANEHQNNSNSAKISCSPGIHLSVVETLFKTPENPRQSTVLRGGKPRCILNFKPNSSSKTKTGNETNVKSASARKSVEVTRKTNVVQSFRMCKSLNINEITSKSLSAEKIQIEQSKLTFKAPKKEIDVENMCNKDSTPAKKIIETISSTESGTTNTEMPEIIVTEATFMDQNENNETLELVNKTEEEAAVENSKVESPNKVKLDHDKNMPKTSDCGGKESAVSSKVQSPNRVQFHDESKFETSDHDEKMNSENSKTVLLQGSITDDTGSPIITQKCCSAVSNIELDSKMSLSESKTGPEETKSPSMKDASDLDASKTSVITSSHYNSQISNSSITDSNDFDIPRKNNVMANLNNSEMADLLFKEANRVDVPEHNTRKHDEIEDELNINFIRISQSTLSSQENGMKINTSSGVMNNVEKEVESTLHSSNSSQTETTLPEFFKPISFSESSNASRIESAVSNLLKNFSKPNSPSEIKVDDDIFTPVKNASRESSTPQSSVIGSRTSLRIHKCNINDTANKSCIFLHNCSRISDESQTQDNTENAKNPREIYKQVVDELNIKLVSVKEKNDTAQELLTTKENTAEEVSEPVLCSKSTQLIYSAISSSHSISSPTKEITVSTKSPELTTTHDEQLEHVFKNKIMENTSADPKELCDVHEVTADILKALTVNENSQQIENLSTIAVTIENIQNVSSMSATNEGEDSKKTNDVSDDTITNEKRSLRTCKEDSSVPVADFSKQEVATRTRQRDRSTLKTKIIQLKEDLNEAHDDKENICSLLKVIDKPKKTQLSTEQITAEEPVMEKKTRKPRRLKNVENIATEAESQQTVGEVGKQSCSIVLTPLDPEIMKSPVKVDESDNISPIEEPSLTLKRKRATKAANKTELKPPSTASRTRQRQVKAVTFDTAQRKSKQVTQQMKKNDTQSKTTSKQNPQSKACVVKPAVATNSKKLKVNHDVVDTNEPPKNYEIMRTITIQLEPVDESFTSPIEPLNKRTRSKRGVATMIKAQKSEKEAKEKKTKTPRATKRAPENMEENTVEFPKRRRVKAEVVDESSSKENTKSKNNDEIVNELPKRTRTRAKTNVLVETETPVNSLSKTTRATRNKPFDIVTSHSGTRAKKHGNDVELSTQNNSEKSNKKMEPVKRTTGEKLTKKRNAAAVSARHIPCEEPVAHSYQKILTPRLTRSRKTEIVKSKKDTPVKHIAKGTPVTKKKNVPVDQNTPVSSKHTRNMKKSPPVEKAVTKRTVATRAKKLSVQKGRKSSTLKTSGRGSLVRKSAETTSAGKPVTSNVRNTRRRAN